MPRHARENWLAVEFELPQTFSQVRQLFAEIMLRRIDEIPEKKKGAVGVRGMKLVDHDQVTDVYLLHNGGEQVTEYRHKKIELNKLKLGKRDTKGVKIRL